ncbi:hypothetical protein K466DRAFT_326856 [Polyporus arcularius HHB13444]|uniref:Uncharacterized protein n=1 Tax=Polyporus arcularius HHB13444 TaxID=1314778 RepID=A0A5C3PQC3_9APHY|nr:hypothetical protein K466DRAFT_326856 [Polyporus arcularius HHB13444]
MGEMSARTKRRPQLSCRKCAFAARLPRRSSDPAFPSELASAQSLPPQSRRCCCLLPSIHPTDAAGRSSMPPSSWTHRGAIESCAHRRPRCTSIFTAEGAPRVPVARYSVCLTPLCHRTNPLQLSRGRCEALIPPRFDTVVRLPGICVCCRILGPHTHKSLMMPSLSIAHDLATPRCVSDVHRHPSANYTAVKPSILAPSYAASTVCVDGLHGPDLKISVLSQCSRGRSRSGLIGLSASPMLLSSVEAADNAFTPSSRV